MRYVSAETKVNLQVKHAHIMLHDRSVAPNPRNIKVCFIAHTEQSLYCLAAASGSLI